VVTIHTSAESSCLEIQTALTCFYYMEFLNRFSSSRSEVPWRFVQWSAKLSRTVCQLSFLLKCRKEGLVPKFIERSVRAPNNSRGRANRVRRRLRYCRQLLNDAIEDKFVEKRVRLEQTQVFRQRLWDYTKQEYLWVRRVQQSVTYEERKQASRRLHWKHRDLRNRQIGEDGLATSVRRPTGEGDVGVRPHGVQRERALVVDGCLSGEATNLLERGPSFVPSTGKVTPRERAEVETAVERMAFTLRWQQASPQDTHVSADSADVC